MDKTKEKNFISAVVYVHNAEDMIEYFLNTLNTYLSNTFLKYEIICVNDGSADNSVSVIRKFADTEKDGMVSILNMSYFQGMEMAMNAGVDLAIGDFVYEFDTTVISYPLKLMRDLYDRCLQGYDIVAACPKSSGHPISDVFYRLYNGATGSHNKIRTEAFRILSRRAINRVQSMSKTLPYRKAVYANCGLQTDAILYAQSVKIPPAKLEERDMQKETAIDALILYTNIAYRFAFSFSALMIIITLAVAVYTVTIYMTSKPIQGWTTTMSVLAFGFFGVSCLMTILIKYASLILRTVFTKQKYVIESIEKLK